MPVDSQQVAWLKGEALKVAVVPGGVSWSSSQAVSAEYLSPIDGHVDAASEAARTAALLGGPNSKDLAIVKGRRRDLLFKCVTITNSRLGYSGAGKKVFVIGVQENDNNTTTLTVLRKLP